MSKLSIRDRNINYPDRCANYEYSFEIARVGGKRKQLRKSGFKTKKEAYEAGYKAMNEYLNTGKVFKPTEMSVSDYLDYWLKSYVKLNLADSTFQAYQNIVKHHIKPRIGKFRLRSIDTMTLQNMINEIFNENKYSNNFQKNILKVLKGAFLYAKIPSNLINDNPAQYVKLPRTVVKETNIFEKYHILTKDEIERILKRFQNSPYQYYALLVSYYTGLRVSEVFGLTWDSINFENKTITINKIAKKIQDEKCKTNIYPQILKSHTTWYLGDCKTPSSYRTIKMSESLYNALLEFKKLQEENKKLYGEFYIKNYIREVKTSSMRTVFEIIPFYSGCEVPEELKEIELVMINESGEFHGSDSMKYPSKIINDELKIPFKFHSLRHTHATMLYECGAPIKDIQSRLGHSSILTTMNTYVENTNSLESRTCEIFEENSSININIKKKDKRLYELWKSLINRCNTFDSYYKKRNIKVCNDWANNFDCFFQWAINNGYDNTLYLQRINKNGDYCPENCIWVDIHQVKSYKQKDFENKKLGGHFVDICPPILTKQAN